MTNYMPASTYEKRVLPYVKIQEEANQRQADEDRKKLVDRELARFDKIDHQHRVTHGGVGLYAALVGWLTGAIREDGRATVEDLIYAVNEAERQANR